jgi:hypothetical protein
LFPEHSLTKMEDGINIFFSFGKHVTLEITLLVPGDAPIVDSQFGKDNHLL